MTQREKTMEFDSSPRLAWLDEVARLTGTSRSRMYAALTEG